MDMREGHILGSWPNLEGASGDPPVSAVGLRMADGDVLPRQRVQAGEQPRLIFLDTQHELSPGVMGIASAVSTSSSRVGSTAISPARQRSGKTRDRSGEQTRQTIVPHQPP
jgi:hypothetical protein